MSKITSHVQENLSGIRVIHAFAQEETEKKKFDELNKVYIHKNLSVTRLFGVFTPALTLTVGLAAMISLWVGGEAVIAKEMSLGSFVAFNGYLLMLSWPMMGIGFIVNLTQKGQAAMSRIQEIFLARPPNNTIVLNYGPIPGRPPTIFFNYPPFLNLQRPYNK